ncbi:hypothetical protein KDA15_19965, partial [Proteus mirabilis]
RHVPRPCNTVFTYSLSLSGKFFYPQPKCLPLLDIASQCPSLPLDHLNYGFDNEFINEKFAVRTSNF